MPSDVALCLMHPCKGSHTINLLLSILNISATFVE